MLGRRRHPETDDVGPEVAPGRWWQRRGPSVIAFLAVFAVIGVAAIALTLRVSDVLPGVGQDVDGTDPWNDPIGVEATGDFQVARVPTCASAPIFKILLWDDKATPLWEVSGPAVALQSFVVGVAPDGFKVETPYRKPVTGSLVRLIVIRRLKGPAGVRYRATDLRKGRVVALPTLSTFTVDGFLGADVCGASAESGGGSGPKATASSTTLIGG